MKEIEFISIKVKKIEIDPTSSVEAGQIRSYKLNFDRESKKHHQIAINFKDFIKNKSILISSFFITIMPLAILFGLIYSILTIGLEIDFKSDILFLNMLYLIIIVLFFLIFLLIVYYRAINNIMIEYVKEERGQGEWKLMNVEKWEKFDRLLKLSNL